MPASITPSLPAPARSLGMARAATTAWRRVAIATLAMARIALLVFVAYAGAIIVRNITQALCTLTGHRPPPWTAER